LGVHQTTIGDDLREGNPSKPSPAGDGNPSKNRLAHRTVYSQDPENSDWYTPSDYIEIARNTMGAIDLDPASSEVAQRVVGATTFYTKDEARVAGLAPVAGKYATLQPNSGNGPARGPRNFRE
jgi:hypothetical protein